MKAESLIGGSYVEHIPGATIIHLRRDDVSDEALTERAERRGRRSAIALGIIALVLFIGCCIGVAYS